jgi:HEAT repeat protein
LGKIGPAAVEAVPALIAARADAYEDVRQKAANALGKIGRGAHSRS